MKKFDFKKCFMSGIILITTAIMSSKVIMAAESNFLMETGNISENSLQIESGDIQINAENFPDPVFRQYLSNQFDTDKDGKIRSSSISTISINGTFQSQYVNLRSVEGIAYFPYLRQINITNTNLESIDISSNKSLLSIDVSNNCLTSIDLRNTTLSGFRCDCDGNQLKVNADHIDLSTLKNFDIFRVAIWRNALISGNILYPEDENKPVTFDYFIQDDGLIKEFSISFKKSRGEKLIEINDTNFPDAAFRNYLFSLDSNHDNKLDVNHIYEISVDDTQTIHDLKGIELFPYLTHIRVCGTQITQLDLSHNIFITEAICTRNYWMTRLNVKKCPHLSRLACSNNDLEELDVTNNFFLVDLTCDGNQIKYLDVSNNLLTYLHCNENQLTSLDISMNYGLQQSSVGMLECMDNKLIYYGTALDLSSLPGFQLEKASEWNNANIANGILTPINALEDVSYSYNISKNRKCTFYISFRVENENPSGDDKPLPDENPSQDVDIPKGPDSWIGKTGTEGFVYRLYNVAMNREADDWGFNDWNTQLKNKKKTAAEVAQGFIFSDEFKNFNYNNVQYVKILYRTMFGREADEGGLNGWVSDLENGMSREYVYRGFAESAEFTNLCGNYGVERGTVTLSAYRDKNVGATGFIARLYTKMLGRGYDEDGLEYWCKKYLTKEKTIEDIARDGFLHSEELKNQNLSNEEFVTRMYQTFLNRNPDEAGLKDWIGRLERGEETKDSLVYGFTNSQEFGKIKASYGL